MSTSPPNSTTIHRVIRARPIHPAAIEEYRTAFTGDLTNDLRFTLPTRRSRCLEHGLAVLESSIYATDPGTMQRLRDALRNL